MKLQNIKLMKKITSIKKNKKYNDLFISNSEEDNDITITQTDIDKFINTNSFKYIYYNNEVKKNKEGKYYNNDIIYDSLVGSRDDVWNCKSYKTTGGLTKNDLMLNHNGKIVSKKKSISESYMDRFKMHGVNKNT